MLSPAPSARLTVGLMPQTRKPTQDVRSPQATPKLTDPASTQTTAASTRPNGPAPPLASSSSLAAPFHPTSRMARPSLPAGARQWHSSKAAVILVPLSPTSRSSLTPLSVALGLAMPGQLARARPKQPPATTMWKITPPTLRTPTGRSTLSRSTNLAVLHQTS